MDEYSLSVPKPVIEDYHPEENLLCGPGPANLWPSVKEALTEPINSPLCPSYFKVVAEIRAGLQYVFQTKSRLVLAVSGAGHAGMETVVSNLVAPGETLFIASRGIWDERIYSIAKRYGVVPAVKRVPMNTTFTLEMIEPELKRLQPRAMFIVQGDSSTGTVQNIEGLGDLCHKYGVLLIVDTVVSLGAEPFFMDKWGVDAVYAGAQKALSGPAGIAPVAFSALAEQRIYSKTHDAPFYFDVKLLAEQWNCLGDTRVYHHTLSPPLCWALRACLKQLAEETLTASWARHAMTTAHFYNRLKTMNVEFLVPKLEDRLVTVTTVVLPKRYDYMKFVTYIRDKYKIIIFGGLGPTAGKALRIGIMGVNSTVDVADRVADAMEDALQALAKSSL